MKFRIFGLAVAPLAALSLIAAPASAAQFIRFQSLTGIDFTLRMSDTLNPFFENNTPDTHSYDVLGVEAGGTLSGMGITGLVANPNQPFVSLFQGQFYDNSFFVLGPSNPTHFDSGGIILSLANFNYAHVFGDGGVMKVQLIMPRPGQAPLLSPAFPQTFTYTVVDGNRAVPEPATWALMILGFGAAGIMLRRRRTVSAS